MPPAPVCHVCQSSSDTWPLLSGEGVLYSFTVVRHSGDPRLAAAIPYVGGVVELDGTAGVRMFANIVDVEPEDTHIGMRLTVVWDDLPDEVTIARFRPEQ
jgi:uncharacterized OB-fold protein